MGATGVTGKIARTDCGNIMAQKVVVTGRNEEKLKELLALGLMILLAVKQDDDAILSQIKALHQQRVHLML